MMFTLPWNNQQHLLHSSLFISLKPGFQEKRSNSHPQQPVPRKHGRHHLHFRQADSHRIIFLPRTHAHHSTSCNSIIPPDFPNSSQQTICISYITIPHNCLQFTVACWLFWFWVRGYFPNCRLPSAPPPAARGPCFAIIWNPADVCFGNDKKTAYLQFSCYIGFESCRYSLLLRLTVFNKYAPPFTPLVIYCLTLYWSMCTNVMCAVQLATRMYTLCLTLEQLCALMLCAVVGHTDSARMPALGNQACGRKLWRCRVPTGLNCSICGDCWQLDWVKIAQPLTSSSSGLTQFFDGKISQSFMSQKILLGFGAQMMSFCYENACSKTNLLEY